MEDFSWFKEENRYTPSLEELTLLSCHLDPLALRKVLAVPKALRKFTLNGSGGQLPHHSHPERKPYMEVIEQQARSLQVLDLCFSFLSSDVNSAVSLHSLTQLEDVSVSSRLLEQGSGTGEQTNPPRTISSQLV
ncbi:hypothetical protein BDV12DRAFT_138385 [Aspergillus spectabilis]